MELNELKEQLAAPMPFKWMPQVTKKGPKNNRVDLTYSGQQVAYSVAYIDARDVMDRLDEVVGPENWSDSYQPSAIGKGVECTLTICGVSKSDVGVPSNTEGEKGAYSDAFKRTAVKFGVGRFLYEIEMRRLPFDGFKITDTKHIGGPLNRAVEEVPGQSPTKATATKRKPTTTPPPPPANGNGQTSHKIADLRATIEGADEKVTVGFVAQRLYDAGVGYNAKKHALNSLKKAAGDSGKLWGEDYLVERDRALKMYDWGIEHKQEAA